VPVQQPYAGVDFIPQSGIYEFGYRTVAVSATTTVKAAENVLLFPQTIEYYILFMKCFTYLIIISPYNLLCFREAVGWGQFHVAHHIFAHFIDTASKVVLYLLKQNYSNDMQKVLYSYLILFHWFTLVDLNTVYQSPCVKFSL
jgi:hypothetical protein